MALPVQSCSLSHKIAQKASSGALLGGSKGHQSQKDGMKEIFPTASSRGAEKSGGTRVSLTELKTGFSPRLAGESSAHIRMLSQVEDELPPIIVHQASMRIVDGMHRFRAAILRGDTTIMVRFLDCDESEAFAAAVEMNVKHGLALSLADRKAAARRILDVSPQWSDRMVGSKTGLSHKTVGALRKRAGGEIPQSHTRIGRDGRLRQPGTAVGREEAASLLRQYPDKSLRSVAKLTGVSVGTVRDVRLRLENGLDPVPNPRQFSLERPEQTESPGAPQAPPAVGTLAEEHPSPSLDVKEILQRLSKDPSLRFSENGRRLIRLLQDSMTFTMMLAALAEDVPPHQAHAIARLVRSCADSLSSTARRLEQASPKSQTRSKK